MSHNKNYGSYYKSPNNEESNIEKEVKEVQAAESAPEVATKEPKPEVKEVSKETPKKAKSKDFAIVVNAKKVNMRADARKDAPVLMILDQGTKVEVLDISPDKLWNQIKFKNTTGYMMSKFLKAVN